MTELVDTLSTIAEEEELAENLLNNFKYTLDYLDDNYYDWVQAKCPHFTDHGERHIKTVLHQASELLSEQLEDIENSGMNYMEIYVLLSSIIWHDVGMVQSRSGHEDFPTEMSEEIKSTLFPNPGLQQVISRIVQAHTGDQGLEITRSTSTIMYKHENFELHPRAIAAVLRFADEISEGQGRVSSASAVVEEVPEESRIYWEFARSISGISVDHPGERIIVNFDLNSEDMTDKYYCPDSYQGRADDSGEISLIEYIVCRLEKMNNEKAYCAPEFRRYAYIREIEARFIIQCPDNSHRKKSQVLGEGGLKRENGYPDITIFEDFFDENGDLEPGNISTPD